MHDMAFQFSCELGQCVCVCVCDVPVFVCSAYVPSSCCMVPNRIFKVTRIASSGIQMYLIQGLLLVILQKISEKGKVL